MHGATSFSVLTIHHSYSPWITVLEAPNSFSKPFSFPAKLLPFCLGTDGKNYFPLAMMGRTGTRGSKYGSREWSTSEYWLWTSEDLVDVLRAFPLRRASHPQVWRGLGAGRILFSAAELIQIGLWSSQRTGSGRKMRWWQFWAKTSVMWMVTLVTSL